MLQPLPREGAPVPQSVEAKIPYIKALALEGDEWSASWSSSFIVEKMPPHYPVIAEAHWAPIQDTPWQRGIPGERR